MKIPPISQMDLHFLFALLLLFVTLFPLGILFIYIVNYEPDGQWNIVTEMPPIEQLLKTDNYNQS